MLWSIKNLTTPLPAESILNVVMGAVLGGFMGVALAGIDASSAAGKEEVILIIRAMTGFIFLIVFYHWFALSIAIGESFEVPISIIMVMVTLGIFYFFVIEKFPENISFQLMAITFLWGGLYTIIGVLGRGTHQINS